MKKMNELEIFRIHKILWLKHIEITLWTFDVLLKLPRVFLNRFEMSVDFFRNYDLGTYRVGTYNPLGTYRLGAYNFEPPILELASDVLSGYILGGLRSEGLMFTLRSSRHPNTWWSTLLGSTVSGCRISGNRSWMWSSTHGSTL